MPVAGKNSPIDERLKHRLSDIRKFPRNIEHCLKQRKTVSAATEEQGAAIEEVATASRQLAEMAAKLQQAVAEFKLR